MDSDNPRTKAFELLRLSSIAYLEAYQKWVETIETFPV